MKKLIRVNSATYKCHIFIVRQTPSVANAEQVGDMDLDGTVGLSEAVIALRVSAGLDPGVSLGTHTPAVITVKTSNGDFDNPIDAMNSITDSSEENPYTILIGPGTFNLYIDPLIMKPYVVEPEKKLIQIKTFTPGNNFPQ